MAYQDHGLAFLARQGQAIHCLGVFPYEEPLPLIWRAADAVHVSLGSQVLRVENLPGSKADLSHTPAVTDVDQVFRKSFAQKLQ